MTSPRNSTCPGLHGLLGPVARRLLLALGMVVWSRTAVAGAAPDYLREVRPLLAEHCFQCHGPDRDKRQAGLRLDRRDGATTQLDSGKTAIQTTDRGASELLRRIESDDPDLLMPPPAAKKQLTADQKQLLRRWIEAGAPYSEHWGYVQPIRPALPDASDPTSDPTWARNGIDRFVLAKLDQVGLRPSSEAVRTLLIRRLSLDLTGLPPSTEEVGTFLEDRSPNAFERLVERLLASPHFGEKLAQDWLDLARFGDSSGYQDDGDRPNSPYRDYVIDAFNDSMPFDQFTLENLAGDLLPGATVAQKIASGFNRLHRHNEEGGSDPEEFQVVYAVDRTSTTATTWMGLTFGCAQCHDHKYDPFTQREFYEFYAFFNSLKGEVVISKRASPPQIPVPGLEVQQRLDRLASELAAIEAAARQLRPAVATAFERWLQEQLPGNRPTGLSPGKSSVKTGAVGGTIARSVHTAYYADTKIEQPLTLHQPIGASGKIAVVRSVNNVVDIGHFSAKAVKGEAIGFAVAEGPRFFAYLGLPDGTRLTAGPIAGEHGVEYFWSYRYDPTGGTDDPADTDTIGEGLLTFELQRMDKRIGAGELDLNAAQRKAAARFNAFGVSYRGASDADKPIDVYLDDLEYTVSADGQARQQRFDRDPEWAGNGNESHGHQFGYDASATTSGGAASLTIEQMLALPAEARTPLHVARLREHFISERFPELRRLDTRAAALVGQRDEILQSAPRALIWEEMEPPRPAQILIRGDYQHPGDLVERNVPSIFPHLPAGARDRRTLANWLASGEHPLTARVAVNRFWKQCFGAGLVRTPEDFGIRGELPTHPELLDWLALEFQGAELGPTRGDSWDMKRLLRRIVTSATYRQSSNLTPQLRELDPDNRLLARGARYRLTAEEIRDVALAVSGLLSRRVGGRSVYPYQPDHFYRDKEDDPGEWKWPLEAGADLYRRGLYTFRRRTTPYPSYLTFDAPSRGECTVARSRTNTPLQALVTMNDPVFVEAARVLGERVAMHGTTSEERLTYAFLTVLSRSPASREREVVRELFQTQQARYRSDPQAAREAIAHGRMPRSSDLDPVEVAAWTAVATTLLNLDETITRE